MVISADIFAVLLRYFQSSIGNLIINSDNMNSTESTLPENGFLGLDAL